MKIFQTLWLTAGVGLLAQVYGQPVVREATNTAGYMRAGLPNGGLAQGSYIAIKGSNLGPAIPAAGIAVSGYPLTTSFSGVAAKIGTTDLIIVYASPGQVGAIVPSSTPVGTANLTVTYSGQTSAALSVQVVARAFGIFTLNQGGTGPVVALKFIDQGNQPPSTLVQAVNPGGTLTLYGTGLGRSNNPDTAQATDLSIPGLNASDVEVYIGGKRANVVRFIGRSSCCASIDQIVVDVPADTPTGCYVSLVVRVAGIPSNSTTISVAPTGNVCSDPNGYSAADLTAAQARGSLRSGYIGLTKGSVAVPQIGNQISDNLSGYFSSYTFDQLIRSQGSDSFISVGSCRVLSFEGDSPTTADPIAPTGLDAGTALTATNANGNQTLTKVASSPGLYSKSITVSPIPLPIPIEGFGPEYLTTGNHTVTGPGGANVGVFSASITWPAAFVWSNRDATTAVNRASGLTVDWTGGDPQGFVSIFGYSAASLVGKNIGAAFICLENANKGTLTVPSAITGSLPASATIQGIPFGSLSVTGISMPKSFTASGIDSGYITYQSGQTKVLAYQ